MDEAGLTMSHALTRRGLSHVVLERHRIAERWRSERWDSLRFQFPNWSLRLPDFPYAGDDPDAYAPRDEVVRFIEDYAAFIGAPVRTGVAVHALRRGPDGDGFLLDTGEGTMEAANVVIATGPYQKPLIPEDAENLPGLFQIAASAYRDPGQLPPGGVLVVGSGASGCQIAEELLRHGRPVFLSVGAHRRAPRRYRGRDFIWWITELGFDEKIADAHAVRQAPLLISGAEGGQTVDLRAYAAAGMVLLGRFRGARDRVASFAPDLAESLDAGDASYAGFLRTADAHGTRCGLALPEEADDTLLAGETRQVPDPIETLDLRAHGIGTVIWATGYQYDFGWIGLDVLGPSGEPLHRRGVTPVPGVYFLGLPLLHKTKSSFLSGVGEDADWLASHIAERRAG